MFEKKDELSQREKVIALFEGRQSGDVVGYDEIGDALGVADRSTIQSVTHAAKRGLLVDQGKAVEAVRGVGYRIVEPNEHIRLAGAQQKKSSRALTRSKRTVDNVDFNSLTEDERQVALAAGRAIGFLLRETRRLNVRQENLEASLESVVQQQERGDEETQRLRERLDRLEAKLA